MVWVGNECVCGSCRAIRRSNCFHERGHEAASCQFSSKPYMVGIGASQIILSQIRNIEDLWWLSLVATITSFGYSSIGAGLAFATIVSGKFIHTYIIHILFFSEKTLATTYIYIMDHKLKY